MAVKTLVGNDPNYLDLRFDNGDKAKLDEVISKWNFKDYQSFMRFVISIMLVTEEKFLSILVNGEAKPIMPAAEFIAG